eukprot:427791-Amphidinium_carterae.1
MHKCEACSQASGMKASAFILMRTAGKKVGCWTDSKHDREHTDALVDSDTQANWERALPLLDSWLVLKVPARHKPAHMQHDFTVHFHSPDCPQRGSVVHYYLITHRACEGGFLSATITTK